MAGPDRETQPVAVTEFELSGGEQSASAFGSPYEEAEVLVRLRRTPVGVVRVRLREGRLERDAVEAAVEANASIRDRVRRLQQKRFLLQHHPEPHFTPPTWTLVICTRNRTEDLKRCLQSLQRAEGIATGQVLIVDNAPSTDDTKRLVDQSPFTYLRLPQPGLNRARDAGARAATGEVVLYTDDDTIIDRGWIASMLKPFDSLRVGAVTGLTLPLELQTPAQHHFNRYGGHARGFEPKCHDRNSLNPAAAGGVGSGANTAFRRDLLVGLNVFGAELDCGTAALSGGDAYAFYRVLAAGYQVRYTPDALVWHRDRREWSELKRMLYGYSVGVFAFLSRILCVHREADAIEVGLSWLKQHHLKQTLRSVLRRPGSLALPLLMCEWRGVVVGPLAYRQTRRHERHQHGGNT